jgi:hypothetical protein
MKRWGCRDSVATVCGPNSARHFQACELRRCGEDGIRDADGGEGHARDEGRVLRRVDSRAAGEECRRVVDAEACHGSAVRQAQGPERVEGQLGNEDSKEGVIRDYSLFIIHYSLGIGHWGKDEHEHVEAGADEGRRRREPGVGHTQERYSV